MKKCSFENIQTESRWDSLGRLALFLSLCFAVGGCTTTPQGGSRPLYGAHLGNRSTDTPPHNLPKSEYPFDDSGRYRTDWVSASATGANDASSSLRGSTSTVSAVKPKSNPKSSAAGATSNSSQKSSSTLAKTSSSKPKPRSELASAPAPITASAPKPKSKPTPSARSHTVAKGETLWGISRRYGTTVAAVKSASHLSSDTIRPGQTLKIP